MFYNILKHQLLTKNVNAYLKIGSRQIDDSIIIYQIALDYEFLVKNERIMM
jgi:hypothetical protein